jgi:repressor LexA
MPLTKRQKEILDFLDGFLSEHGYPPSFEEIALRLPSLATVHEHLENLRQRIGKSNASRASSWCRQDRSGGDETPRSWAGAAGQPIEAITDQRLAVPEGGDAGVSIACCGSGRSMIDGRSGTATT